MLKFKIFIVIVCIFLLCGCERSEDVELTDDATAVNATMSLEISSPKNPNAIKLKSNGESGIQMTFGGDISFADNWHVIAYAKRAGLTPKDCISSELVDEMKSADIAHMNNEFCFSTRGTPLPGKMYTFRANPQYVSFYDELGIDFVTLANNHIFDYGENAFLDTLSTLKDAGIEYVGAGKDIEEATKPLYYYVEGKVIAMVAATRAEKNVLTPGATKSTPGTLRCYDTKRFIEVIKEAKENSDFVVALIHWGTEDSNKLEDVQMATAKQYIDAGADIIVGGHAHCLQGIEYYKGVPIIYNLGNFWFSKNTIDTGLLKVTLNEDNSLEIQFIPAIQQNCFTTYVGGTNEGKRILADMRSYSINASIDENGFVTEK